MILKFYCFLMHASNAINFFPGTALAVDHKFLICYIICFIQFKVLKKKKISLDTFSSTHRLFRNMFSFQLFGDFLIILLLQISNLIPLWLENILHVISILFNYSRVVIWPWNWSWNMLHGHLKKMCIFLLLDGVFYTCWTDLFG